MNATIATPTPSQQAAAEQLLASPEKWSHGRSKVSGEHFWLIQGSNGVAHWATASGCTCRGFRFRGMCSHVLAVKLRRDRDRAARRDVGPCSPCRWCGLLVPPISRGHCLDCAAETLGF